MTAALAAELAAHHLRGGTFAPNLGFGVVVVAIVFWLLVRSPKVPPGK